MMFLQSFESASSPLRHAQDAFLRILDLSAALVLEQAEMPANLSWSSELHRNTYDDVVALFARVRQMSLDVLNMPAESDNAVRSYRVS